MMEQEEPSFLGLAAISAVVLMVAAFVAAWLFEDHGLLSLVPPASADDPNPVPDVQDGEEIALYQAAFSAWAALVLLVPTYVCFWFRAASGRARALWLAFWTMGAVAYLVHLAVSMFGFFQGDFAWMTSSTRVSAFWPGMVVALWWPVDVALAYARGEDALWIRIQRVALHLVVLILFVGGSLGTGELGLARALGLVLLLGALGSLVRWAMTRNRATV